MAGVRVASGSASTPFRCTGSDFVWVSASITSTPDEHANGGRGCESRLGRDFDVGRDRGLRETDILAVA
jgi:hypothetical protein